MAHHAAPIQQTPPVPNPAGGSQVSGQFHADALLCAIEQCVNGWVSGCAGNAGIGEALSVLEMYWAGSR